MKDEAQKQENNLIKDEIKSLDRTLIEVVTTLKNVSAIVSEIKSDQKLFAADLRENYATKTEVREQITGVASSIRSEIKVLKDALTLMQKVVFGGIGLILVAVATAGLRLIILQS